MKIKTKELQNAVSRVVNGCSNDKMLPITSMLSISVGDDMVFQTSDGTNYLYVFKPVEDADAVGFNVVVSADKFAKLVSKMTSEETEMILKDRYLEVKGNGTYKIDIILDEETGEVLKFPDPLNSGEQINPANTVDLELSLLKDIVAVNKSALSAYIDIPCYANYYVGDTVITTDTFKICEYDEHIFDEAVLLPQSLMNLVPIMTGEKVKIVLQDDIIIIDSDDVTVYGHVYADTDEFAIDSISELLSTEMPCTCKVAKSAVLNALDRLSLFVEDYDKNTIRMTFTAERLILESKQTSAVEEVAYKEMQDAKPFTAEIDISMLQSQVKSQSSDLITIEYNNESIIKLIDGSVTQVIALTTK